MSKNKEIALENITGLKHELARSIRMHQKSSGITQKQLADSVGVSQPYISRIMAHELTGVSVEKLIVILMCLDIKVDINIGKQDDEYLFDVTHVSFPE